MKKILIVVIIAIALIAILGYFYWKSTQTVDSNVMKDAVINPSPGVSSVTGKDQSLSSQPLSSTPISNVSAIPIVTAGVGKTSTTASTLAVQAGQGRG